MKSSSDEIVLRLPGRWLLGLLLLGALLWLLLYERRLVTVFFLATLLAVGIAPPVAAMARRGVPRGIAIGIIYLVLILVVGGAAALLVPLVSQQAELLATQGPTLAAQATALLTRLLPEGLASRLPDSMNLQTLAGQGLSTAGSMLARVAGVLLTVGQSAVLTILILAMVYFMVADERLFDRMITRFIPPAQRPTARALGTRLATQLGRWVRAQGLISLYYGTTFAAAMALLGVPFALTLGVLGALLELVPYVGGFVATGFAMLVAFTVDPIKAVWVLVAHLIIGNIEAHAITPKLLGSRLGLPPLAVVIALFVGAELLGIMGMLLAVPLLVVGQVLLDHFYLPAGAEVVETEPARDEARPGQRAVGLQGDGPAGSD